MTLWEGELRTMIAGWPEVDSSGLLPEVSTSDQPLAAKLLATSATWRAALHHHHCHHPHQLCVGRAVWLHALTQMNQARLPFWAESAGWASNHSTERFQQVAAWGDSRAAQSWPSPRHREQCTYSLRSQHRKYLAKKKSLGSASRPPWRPGSWKERPAR